MFVTNLQVGNALIDFETENRGMYDYFWTHGLISDEIHDKIVSNCNFSSDATVSDACRGYTDQADAMKGNIFIFDIYAPWCSSSTTIPVNLI